MRLLKKRALPVSVVGIAIAMGVAGASVASLGGSDATPAVAASSSSSWEDKYAVLRQAQTEADVFRATDPKYVDNATKISRDSRLLATDKARTVHAFRDEDRLCLIWRDIEHGVASSGCRTQDEGNPPGMMVIHAPEFKSSLLVSMVPDGASVAITAPNGTTLSTPSVDRNVVVVDREGDFNLVIGETKLTPKVVLKARPRNPDMGSEPLTN